MDCITTVQGVKTGDVHGEVNVMKDGKIRVSGKELSSSTQVFFTPNDHKTISSSVCYEEHRDGNNAIALTIAPTTADFWVAGVEP